MKTLLAIKLFILASIFAALSINAENSILISSSPVSNITGKIVDKTSGQPVEYATIALYKSTDSSLVTGTITDPEGNFSIEKIDTGDYYVKISFIGYSEEVTKEINISKSGNKADLGSIMLVPAVTQLNEVVIKDERSTIEYKIDKRVINVEKDISSKGGTAVNVLENTPSVQVDAEGNLTLRGSSDYKVLIDGKPSVVKGNDALKQIPSNAIKQIEVITNPSAKYDADGQAGIINVILKKEKMQGFNGSLNASYGIPDRQTANATLNYRKGKLNLFTGADYANNTYNSSINIDNKTFLSSETQYVKESINQFNDNDNLNIRLGFDLDLNDKNSFTLVGSIGRQGYDNGNNATSNVSNSSATYNHYYKSSNYFDITGDVLSINFDYTHKFAEDHKLAVSNAYSVWDGFDDNNLKEWETDINYNEAVLSSALNSTKDNRNYNDRLNVDYSRPLFKGTFEAGAQYRYEERNEDFIFRNYQIDSASWIVNDTFSYYQEYVNTIYSGYLTYSNKVWGIGYQIGLRSEYFMRSIDINTQEGPIEYNKFMFYPSVHLSKEINEKHQVQLSYSRRINRPQAWLLNNTPSYIDTRNVFKGSPYLEPEYTDAFELNYRYSQKIVSVSMQTYYRYTTNPLTQLRLLQDNGVMFHELTNGKNQQSFGVELGLDVKVYKWWQISSNANIYNYKLTTLVSNTDKVQNVNTWDARLINNFSLKWGMRIQSVGYYRAPSVDAMGKNEGFFTTNLSVSQSFLKGKLNVSLTGQNLLNSIKFNYLVNTEQFDNKYLIESKGPVFIINLSYSFNNFQNKQRGRADDLQFKGGGAF